MTPRLTIGRAAAIAHIETVLLQENRRLRRQRQELGRQLRDAQVLVDRIEPGRERERRKMREALAAITWSRTHEEAVQLATEGLEPPDRST